MAGSTGNTEVTEIMTTPVVTVEMDDRLETVSHIFENVRFHHLLVVEEDVLVGVLSDRDFLKAVSPNINTQAETARDAFTLMKRVHQIMSRKPISLRANATVNDAVALFKANTISCIPVVDEANKPIGIISWRDILHVLVD